MTRTVLEALGFGGGRDEQRWVGDWQRESYANEVTTKLSKALKGRRLVVTNGCFDLLGTHHLYLLASAKKAGALVVALNSDESVRRLKGPRRPINSWPERALALLCAGVDLVIGFDESTPELLYQKLQPDILVRAMPDAGENPLIHMASCKELLLVPMLTKADGTLISTTITLSSWKNHV